MNVLVTGAAGSIGSELVTSLIQSNDCFVVGVDNLLTGSMSKLPSADRKNFKFVRADVNNLKEFSEAILPYSFDYVFHYAAVVGVARTLSNPLLVLNDINGIRNVLDISRKMGVRRVFYSSSSEVYGEPVEFPQNERTTPLNSRLPYAVVKNLGEAYLRAYHQEYGLSYSIFRFFNTYGFKQSEDFVIAKFIRLAMANQTLTINGEGNQTRTFCFIEDNIEVTLKVLLDDLCLNETMNIGSNHEISILELAKKIVKLTGSKSSIEHAPSLKEGDMTRRQPDNTKMMSILNRELTTLDDGIMLTYKALLEENK